MTAPTPSTQLPATADEREGEDSCDGCYHRYWVKCAALGQTMSSSGWGCALSGGHAVKRCQQFLKDEPND